MKRPELYNKTVDILVEAYFNDTLVHGNQCGCAVGNMVAANMGVRLHKLKCGTIVPSYWDDDFVTDNFTIENNGLWYLKKSTDADDIRFKQEDIDKQIFSTGYSWNEILAIERAFEYCQYTEDDDSYMLNGLMAVIDTLDIIHENTDTISTETTKNRFVKRQLIPQP